jgi:hypothetical protein
LEHLAKSYDPGPLAARAWADIATLDRVELTEQRVLARGDVTPAETTNTSHIAV